MTFPEVSSSDLIETSGFYQNLYSSGIHDVIPRMPFPPEVSSSDLIETSGFYQNLHSSEILDIISKMQDW